jgi:hypothetical protein
LVAENLKKNYDEVLKDLHARRSDLTRQLSDLDQLIASINKILIPEFSATQSPTLPFPNPTLKSISNSTRYSHMSVRWAILWLLNDAPEPMSTAEITEALKSGGIQTQATNFTNNVSAVLSSMKGTREELDIDMLDGKWRINQKGKDVWGHIVSNRLNNQKIP